MANNSLQVSSPYNAQPSDMVTVFPATGGPGVLVPINFLLNNPTVTGNLIVSGLAQLQGGFRVTPPQPILTTGASVTMTASMLVNGGIYYQTGSTAATYTLPTGTQMDTAVGGGVITNDQVEWLVANYGTSTITIAAGSGFTLAGTAPVIASGQSRMMSGQRTGTNTWVAY